MATDDETRERTTLDLEAIRARALEGWDRLQDADDYSGAVTDLDALRDCIERYAAEVARLRSLAPGEARPGPGLLGVLKRLVDDVDAINDIDDLLVMANRTGWGDRVTPTMQAARQEIAMAREPSQQNDGWKESWNLLKDVIQIPLSAFPDEETFQKIKAAIKNLDTLAAPREHEQNKT